MSNKQATTMFKSGRVQWAQESFDDMNLIRLIGTGSEVCIVRKVSLHIKDFPVPCFTFFLPFFISHCID